ncbi:signal peptidase I [Nonomuraea africana]|uniref:Signal peptidase I n=1 Tax=Nonomuraea africana TaxID=46171 RepID=A0ABR9KXW3_9ACTN|nr:signal peptidase I [Nonomuraea africana]MBE1566397.1 signal peptidase I [Nonomuraea africana]
MAVEESKKRKGGLKETFFLIALGVGVALLLQAFVVRSFSIPSESMENTLRIGDRVSVNKLHGASERGDIVVFRGWNNEDTIKRVIAVGGDKVACCDAKKRVTVNGIPLDEDYLFPDDYPSGEEFSYTVPKGRLWLMGDHRSASVDSRSHVREASNWISEDQVIGRAWAIYWPLSHATILSRPEIFDKVR